jgi:hypothetical protein
MANWYATHLCRFFLKKVALNILNEKSKLRDLVGFLQACRLVTDPTAEDFVILAFIRCILEELRKKTTPRDALANFDYPFDERGSSRLRDGLPSTRPKDFGQGCYEDVWGQDSNPFAFGQPYPFQSCATNRVEELLTIRSHI